MGEARGTSRVIFELKVGAITKGEPSTGCATIVESNIASIVMGEERIMVSIKPAGGSCGPCSGLKNPEII